MTDSVYEITVRAYDLTDKEAEELFDRVAEVTDNQDQDILCVAGFVKEG